LYYQYPYIPVFRIRDVYPGSRILIFTYPELSVRSQKYGFGIRGIPDPGSGIQKKPTPNPGSRGQKGTGSATLVNIELNFLCVNPFHGYRAVFMKKGRVSLIFKKE
jgi:hypothetical protein